VDNIATNVTIYEYVNDEVGNWIERDLHRAHFLAYFNCASGSGFYIVKEHKHHAITVGNLMICFRIRAATNSGDSDTAL